MPIPEALRHESATLTMAFRIFAGPETTATMPLSATMNRPLTGELAWRLGEEDKRAKRMDAVLERYETALKTDPDFSPIVHWTGRLLGTGDAPRDAKRGEALARHSCALTHEQHIWPLYSLAEVLLAARRWDEARAVVLKARRIAPDMAAFAKLETRCILGAAQATASR